MNKSIFDIVVAKEFELQKDGITEKKTVWNKVGRAWPTKNPGSFNFELYLMPGVRYLLCAREKEETAQDEVPNFDETVPF